MCELPDLFLIGLFGCDIAVRRNVNRFAPLVEMNGVYSLVSQHLTENLL